MNADSKVLDRIRKLLRLSQSSEPHEAANALAQAQRLMYKHRIQEAQLGDDDDEEIRMYSDDPLESGITIAPWRQAIGGAIAELNDCLCLVSDVRKGRRILRKMVIAGRRTDYEVCVLMYRWITDRIEHMARDASTRTAARRRAAGMGLRWLNSFRLGAAAIVEQRLEQERRDQRAKLASDPRTSKALAIRHDAVDHWAKENIEQHDPRGPQTDVDQQAYDLGTLAGRTIPLRPEADGS